MTDHPRVRWLLFVFMCWFATGCLRIFRPVRTVKPNTIGAVLPLSGPYQLVGQAALAGIQLALQGSHVKLVVRDSRGEAAGAEQAVDELALQEGAIALVGGILSEESDAAAKRADWLGVPFVTFSKTDDVTSRGNYVFRNMLTLRAVAEGIARYGSCQAGLKSFAILSPETEYGRALSAAFKEAVEELGGTVNVETTYPAGKTTFTPEAQKLTGRSEPEKRPDYAAKEAAIKSQEQDPTRRRKAIEKLRTSLPPIFDFKAVFLPDQWETISLIAPALAAEDMITNACDPEDMERIRKTLGRSHLKTATLLGWSGWTSPIGRSGTPELIERGGKFVECAVYADGFYAGSARPATRQFVSKFRASHNEQTPNLLNALGYDSALLYRRILEKDPAIDSAKFRDALAQTQGFDGATGTTSFNADREAEKPLFLLQVEKGALRELPVSNTCRPATASR